MTPRKPSNLTASVHQRLLNISQKRGINFNLLLGRYAIERLLYRLSQSRYSHQFVLKGAQLFSVWKMPGDRPTRDVDLLGFGDASSAHLKGVFQEFCQISAEPVSVLQERIGPEETHLPVSRHHQANLIEAVKTRRPTICPIEVAVRSDTICHLGDIAMRLGRRLRWDPVKEEFVNDAQANAMAMRAMRSPWHL